MALDIVPNHTVTTQPRWSTYHKTRRNLNGTLPKGTDNMKIQPRSKQTSSNSNAVPENSSKFQELKGIPVKFKQNLWVPFWRVSFGSLPSYTLPLLREGKPKGFPRSREKVLIVSRTISGLFLVGACNRLRKRKRINRGSSPKIGKVPRITGDGRVHVRKHALCELPVYQSLTLQL